MNKYRVTPTGIKHNIVRFKSTRKNVEITYPALDAGSENEFAKELNVNKFINADLNYKFFSELKYNTITSFEVIEHLQNPLAYIDSIYDSLSEGGVLYLTTPVKWIFKGKYHFHEFSKDELLFCLSHAGFKDVSIKRIQAYTLRHFGIRPIIRKIRDIILGQCFFIKAVK